MCVYLFSWVVVVLWLSVCFLRFIYMSLHINLFVVFVLISVGRNCFVVVGVLSVLIVSVCVLARLAVDSLWEARG